MAQHRTKALQRAAPDAPRRRAVPAFEREKAGHLARPFLDGSG
jgi:hypothetical protein